MRSIDFSENELDTFVSNLNMKTENGPDDQTPIHLNQENEVLVVSSKSNQNSPKQRTLNNSMLKSSLKQ